MDFSLSEAELTVVQNATMHFEEGRLGAVGLAGLAIRPRLVTFLCVAFRHRLSFDGVWMGSFSSLCQELFPGLERRMVSNLATKLRVEGLRKSLKAGTQQFEVFFLTDQLREVVEAGTPQDEGDPEHFVEAITRLKMEKDLRLVHLVAEFIYEHGCKQAKALLNVMSRALDSEV